MICYPFFGGETMFIRIQKTVLLLLALLLLVPVVTFAADPAEETPAAVEAPSEIDLLTEGLALFEAEQPEAAEPMLIAAIEVETDAERLQQAHIALARIYLAEKQFDTVLAQIAAIPVEERNDEARYLEGRALVAISLTREGMAALQGVDPQVLPPSDQSIRLRILAEGNAALGNYQRALWFANRAMRSAPSEDVSGIYRFAQQVVETQISNDILPEIAFMFAGSPVGAAARLQQVELELAAGDRVQAARLIAQTDLGLIPAAYRGGAIRLYTELTGQSWLERSVGVVLPLSGRFAAYGQLVKRGIDLAVEMQDLEESGIRFIYRDNGGDPARSRALVEQLSTADKAVAVAGPITPAASEAAARKAEVEKIPLLTLSQHKGLPEIGPFVFRNSMTARLQVQELARYVVDELGMTGFGVLYPDNRLGREMLDLFSQEVLKRNGLVTTSESYPEDATDFGRQIRLLKGEDPDFREEYMTEQEMLEDLFVPDFPPVDFDALFIPDYADKVGMIAPQLAYYGIEELPLLGINGWNSPDLVRLAGPFVEGAIFVDGFFPYSPYPFVQEFANRYFSKYGEEPTILEAQGFDVANIFISLLSRDNIRSRNDLRLALSQLSNYPGVTGATTFNLVGDAEKILFLLQVQNGNITQINGPDAGQDTLLDEEVDVAIPEEYTPDI